MSRKGQVTIPKAIRDRLGVKEGQKVFFVARGKDVILKVESSKERVRSLHCHLITPRGDRFKGTP